MALVIEDGSKLSNANSYVSVETARDYAASRGITLSSSYATVEQQALLAMDYLEDMWDRFKGEKSTELQSLQWPRAWVEVFGYPIDSDEIPQQLIDAQCELIMAIHAGIDLQPDSSGREVTKEKIDVIEVEYSKGQSVAPRPSLRGFAAKIRPLLRFSGAKNVLLRS